MSRKLIYLCLFVSIVLMESCSAFVDAYDKLDDALDKVERYFYNITNRADDFQDAAEYANRNGGDSGFWDRARESILGEELSFVSAALHHEHEELWDRTGKIQAIRESKYKTQDTLETGYEVFGWHPHWMGKAYESYNFRLLSSVAYFSYDIKPETGLPQKAAPIKDWLNTPMIDSAKAEGCRVLLTITCLNKDANRKFLGNTEAQSAMIDSVQKLLSIRQAQGVNIDFEGIPLDRRGEFTSFIRNLRKRLETAFISITLPAVYSASFDIGQLSDNLNLASKDESSDSIKVKLVDQFVIMGYDFHKRRDNTPTPIAPWYQLEHSTKLYLKLGIAPKDLLLAVPYFGAVWKTTQNRYGPIKKIIAPLDDITYREIAEKDFSPTYNNKDFPKGDYNAHYVEDISDSLNIITNEYWYDDIYTLGHKYDMVKMMELGGIGIWALGYDNGRDELWELLDTKFGAAPVFQPEYAFANRIAFHQLVLLTVGIFFMAAILIGFCVSLLHWRVREFLFLDKRLLLTYAGVFSTIGLLMIWLQPYKYNNANLALILGLLIGFILTQAINAIFRSWRSE